jgi:hypothetical protein
LSRFKTFLKYKALEGNIDTKLINEAYTSQENCLTGKKEFDSSLSNREVKIKDNLIISRDLNSGVNIARKNKQLRSDWLDHIEEYINNLHEMFVDNNSNLQMIKTYNYL